MNTLDQIAEKIVREQALIIGPLAWSEAGRVPGIHVEDMSGVTIEASDPKTAINALVAQYERLFGRASQEVCREAAAPLLVGLLPSEIPSSLLIA